MPVASVVVDASTAIRAIVDRNEEAIGWLARIRAREVYAAWPQLAYAEIANGLSVLVRANRIEPQLAAAGLAYVLAAPIEPESLDMLAEPALAFSLARSVTVYDACYLVLAEAGGATLVTADRKLAAAAADVVLIGA